jgi:DNA repair protein RecO (recombination protein O)
MLQRTEGIVLKTFPYGEADLIVTYLTLDFGLSRAFARSPRKLRSRFGSSLEPLTHSRLAFLGKEDANLPRLTQSDIIASFQGLREDLGCFLILTEMIELVLNMMPERETNRDAFSLLLEVMRMMEHDCARLNALVFKTRFLGLKGYSPMLDRCARCRARSNRFHVSQGSVMCGKCAPAPGRKQYGPSGANVIELSAGIVRLFKALGTWELSGISRIRASEAMVSELSAVLDAHIDNIVSRRFRASEFASPR